MPPRAVCPKWHFESSRRWAESPKRFVRHYGTVKEVVRTMSCLGGTVSKDCAPYDGISTVLLRQGSSQHTMSKRSE